MHTNELTLIAHHRPETLERILRVVRHRGFTVVGMKMRLEGEKIWLDFSVTSPREIHLLINQLAKLYDVIDVAKEE
ncbi:acetolactate synthase 2 small subunit [Pasteurellaceae bacterium LIM206]|nr:acetolactate synthase 2 small subunit [Pasteurellaceae bacterium LIM206]